MKRTLIALLAVLAIAAPVAAWTPMVDIPTDQQRLERLDKSLLPVIGSINAALEDLGLTPGSLNLEPAYLDIIQARAVQGWELTRATPYAECYAQYLATLRVGFAVVADSIDDYRANDPVFGDEVTAGMLLIGPKATLERGATTCDPTVPTNTPQPTAIPTAGGASSVDPASGLVPVEPRR